MIKVHIIHTGKVRVDQAIPHREKNPLAVTGLFRSSKKKMELPVSCYLIEHPNGKILIDTGWDTKYETEKPQRFGGLLNDMSTPIITKAEGVDYQLHQLGVKPADLDYIFLSHMDFDHTSGLRLVKDAPRIMASKEEIADSEKYFFRYVKSNWDFLTIKPFSYSETGVGPVGKSFDVFGDGRVLLINTPGHSNGLFSVKIKNNGKYVLLTSDAAYTRASWEEKKLPGFMVNKEQARKSLEWIDQCVKDPKCIKVIANHDPEIKPGVIEL